jgi:hypothetical protein
MGDATGAGHWSTRTQSSRTMYTVGVGGCAADPPDRDEGELTLEEAERVGGMLLGWRRLRLEEDACAEAVVPPPAPEATDVVGAGQPVLERAVRTHAAKTSDLRDGPSVSGLVRVVLQYSHRLSFKLVGHTMSYDPVTPARNSLRRVAGLVPRLLVTVGGFGSLNSPTPLASPSRPRARRS